MFINLYSYKINFPNLKVLCKTQDYSTFTCLRITRMEQCKDYGKYPYKTCIIYSAYERYINKNRNQIKIRTYVSDYRGLGKRMEVSS